MTLKTAAVQTSYQTLIDALFCNARKVGSETALLLPGALKPRGRTGHTEIGETISWEKLADWVTCLARELLNQIPTHDRLIHVVRNRPEDVLIALSCQAAGIVEIPIDDGGGQEYIGACRKRVDAFWMDDDSKRDMVDRAKHRCENITMQGKFELPPRAPQDDALVLWTSGTSGEPKGVVLSHRSLLTNAMAKLVAVPQRRSDRRLTVLSIAHAYARTCDLNTWLLSGCQLAITRGFQGWCDHSAAISPSLCNMVPSLADRVLGGGLVPQSLRILGCGGAAMTTDQFNRWQEHGVTVIQGYGLTEAGPVIASQTPDNSIAGRVGGFVPGWEYQLGKVGEVACDRPRTNGKASPSRENAIVGCEGHLDEGRLHVRGQHLMSRYLNDVEATSKRVCRDGWMDTGDIVRLCPQTGQLEILGRCDDRMILSNGHSVDPLAVENRIGVVKGVRTAVLAVRKDGRSLELWIEADESSFSQSDLATALKGLPSWVQPRTINPFRVPDSMRDRVFNRKGAVRRAEMLRFVQALDS